MENQVNGGERVKVQITNYHVTALRNMPINIQSIFRDFFTNPALFCPLTGADGICSESVFSFQLWMEALCGLRETCSLGSVRRVVLTLLSEDRGQKWFPDSCSSLAETLDWSAGTCSTPEVYMFIKTFQLFGTILNFRHVVSRIEMKLILACSCQPSSFY